MKKFLLALIVAISAEASYAQNGLDWSAEFPVADGNIYGNTRPRIAITNNGIPVVMWGKSSNGAVYTSRWNWNGFTSPVKVTPDNVSAFVSNWASAEMDASGNTAFVTFHSTPENSGFVYVVKSNDGGASWGDTVRVENIGDDYSRFPTVSVDQSGDPAVAFMRYNSNFEDPEYVVSNSNDGGASFSADVAGSAVAPGEVCDCCPAHIINKGNFQSLLFRNNDSNLRDAWVVVSTDGGSSFTQGADIDNNNWTIFSCPSTGPDAYINGDSLTAVWMSGGSGEARVNIANVNKNDLQLGYTAEVSENVVSNANQNYPRIAGNMDTLGVVYQQAQSGNIDVMVSYSTSGAAGLGSAQNIAINNAGTQRNPDVAFADGKLHMVYQDAASGNVIYRYAQIAGATGINEGEIISAALFPNPNNGNFTLLLPATTKASNARLELFDITGQLVYSLTNLSSGQNFIEQDLKAGTYFYKISDNHSVTGGKLLILGTTRSPGPR